LFLLARWFIEEGDCIRIILPAGKLKKLPPDEEGILSMSTSTRAAGKGPGLKQVGIGGPFQNDLLIVLDETTARA